MFCSKWILTTRIHLESNYRRNIHSDSQVQQQLLISTPLRDLISSVTTPRLSQNLINLLFLHSLCRLIEFCCCISVSPISVLVSTHSSVSSLCVEHVEHGQQWRVKQWMETMGTAYQKSTGVHYPPRWPQHTTHHHHHHHHHSFHSLLLLTILFTAISSIQAMASNSYISGS